jgi:hypothetical protein
MPRRITLIVLTWIVHHAMDCICINTFLSKHRYGFASERAYSNAVVLMIALVNNVLDDGCLASACITAESERLGRNSTEREPVHDLMNCIGLFLGGFGDIWRGFVNCSISIIHP